MHNHLNLPIVSQCISHQEYLLLKHIFVFILDNASLSLIPAADSGDSDVPSFDADGSNGAEAACPS